MGGYDGSGLHYRDVRFAQDQAKTLPQVLSGLETIRVDDGDAHRAAAGEGGHPVDRSSNTTMDFRSINPARRATRALTRPPMTATFFNSLAANMVLQYKKVGRRKD
jgi:hypothetical protein